MGAGPGTIMRRLLRNTAEKDCNSVGDISTLADLSVLGDLIANR